MPHTCRIQPLSQAARGTCDVFAAASMPWASSFCIDTYIAPAKFINSRQLKSRASASAHLPSNTRRNCHVEVIDALVRERIPSRLVSAHCADGKLTKDRFQKAAQGSNDPGASTRGRHFLLFRVTTGISGRQWILAADGADARGVFHDTTRLVSARSDHFFWPCLRPRPWPLSLV